MDAYVKNKLRQWKLEKYISIFRENEVSRNNFHLLTKDAIAGLILNASARKMFLRKFEYFKMKKKKRNAEDPTTSYSEELKESASSSDSSHKSIISSPKTDLEELLLKNHAGKQILSTVKSGKPPTNFLRKKLAVFLFDNLLESCENNPSAQLKMELAKKIVEEFPHLYIQKKDVSSKQNVSHNEQSEYQKENNEIIAIENQMEIEIEPSLPESKQMPKEDGLCDFCSEITSVYISCNGICKLKFCSDCCGIADLKRLSKTHKKSWKCKACRKYFTSSNHSQLKDSLSHDKNSEIVDSSDSSNSVSNTVDPSHALEFYTSAPTDEPSWNSSCHNTSGNYGEANNYDISLEDNISSYQDESSDIKTSGTLALLCSGEPVIKKESNLSYNGNTSLIDELADSEVNSINYSKDATSSQGRVGSNNNVPAANNMKELKKFNVRAILERTEQGKQVLSSIDRGDITAKMRRELTRILVQHLIDEHGLYPRACILKSAALAITEQFPLLSAIFGDHEAWFSKEKINEGANSTPKCKSYRGFLYHRLAGIRRKAAAKKKIEKKKKVAEKSLKGSPTQTTKEPHKVEYTASEMQKAQEEVMNQLNEIWEDMSTCHSQKDADLQKADRADGQERSPGRVINKTGVGNTDSIINYNDCVAVSKDEEFGVVDEEDGLTVVAYDDYCNLKYKNDILEEEIKKERELRKSIEEKLAEVQAEKLALEQEILDCKSKRMYTRWKNTTTEYCRRNFQ